MTCRALGLAAVPFLAALVFAGCAPSEISLRPDEEELLLRTNRGDRGSLAARIKVPDGLPGGLDLVLSSRGAFRHKRKHATYTTVEVELEIENRSESKTAGFYTEASLLRTGQGIDLKPVVPAAEPGASDATATTIAPGERRRFSLVFRANDVADPRDLVPARLRLLFSYDKRDYPETVVLVQDYAQSYGYYGGGYPYGGFYGGYPYGPYGGMGYGYGPLWW